MPAPPPSSVAAALAGVPLLAGLPAELRAQLAAELRTVRLAAGDWLFREGDLAESAFIVRHGRLEVVSAGPPPVVIGVLTRGAVVGELALLGEGARSASVRARRDSELIELPRAQFEMLIRTVPAFAVGLTHSIGERLASIIVPPPPTAPPRSFAVVALDARAPAAEVGDLLAEALRGHGSLARLRADDAGHPDDRAGLLDRAEGKHDRVLLDAASAAQRDGWADFCRSEADLVIAVCGGVPDEGWLARPGALHGCELLVVGAPVSERAIERFAPRGVHATAPAQLATAVDALARRLSGRAVGLVLSGGGARAFAHLGVYDELLAAGVRIDRVGGTSMGALFAGFIARGAGPDEIHAIFQRDFVERNPTNDYTLPAFSLIRGRKTRGMLEERFGDVRIEQLPRRFYCVSCDLIGREVVLHRTGLLRDAIYASIAIPGVYPPFRDGGRRLLVDGGVLDNLPVEPMARMGEGPVIAVDVGQRPDPPPGTDGHARLGRLGRALTGSDVRLPRVGETLVRTLTIGSADSVAAALRHADLVIAPRVEGVRMLDWKQLDRAREIGRRAAREALAAYTGDVRALR